MYATVRRPLQKVTSANFLEHSLYKDFYNSYAMVKTTEKLVQSGKGVQKEYSGAFGLNNPTHRKTEKELVEYHII